MLQRRTRGDPAASPALVCLPRRPDPLPADSRWPKDPRQGQGASSSCVDAQEADRVRPEKAHLSDQVTIRGYDSDDPDTVVIFVISREVARSLPGGSPAGRSPTACRGASERRRLQLGPPEELPFKKYKFKYTIVHGRTTTRNPLDRRRSRHRARPLAGDAARRRRLDRPSAVLPHRVAERAAAVVRSGSRAPASR